MCTCEDGRAACTGCECCRPHAYSGGRRCCTRRERFDALEEERKRVESGPRKVASPAVRDAALARMRAIISRDPSKKPR